MMELIGEIYFILNENTVFFNSIFSLINIFEYSIQSDWQLSR